MLATLTFILALFPGIFLMNAIRVMTDSGHILSFIRRYFPNLHPLTGKAARMDGAERIMLDPGFFQYWISELRYWLSKPIWACEYCTASIWGTVAFFAFAVPFAGVSVWLWPVYCVALVGLRFELNSFSKFLEVKVK